MSKGRWTVYRWNSVASPSQLLTHQGANQALENDESNLVSLGAEKEDSEEEYDD